MILKPYLLFLGEAKDDLAINPDNGYTLDEADNCVFLSKRVKIGI